MKIMNYAFVTWGSDWQRQE